MANSIMSMGLDSTIQDYIAQYDNEEIISSAFFLKQVFSNENGIIMTTKSVFLLSLTLELEGLSLSLLTMN